MRRSRLIRFGRIKYTLLVDTDSARALLHYREGAGWCERARAGPRDSSRSDAAPWLEFTSDLAAHAVGAGRNLSLPVLTFGMER